MSEDYDDREFQLWNDIQAQTDPEGAEYRRKQHEREKKRRKRERFLEAGLGGRVGLMLKILKWGSAAAVAYIVERLLSKYVI
jgi:hypothetical protein